MKKMKLSCTVIIFISFEVMSIMCDRLRINCSGARYFNSCPARPTSICARRAELDECRVFSCEPSYNSHYCTYVHTIMNRRVYRYLRDEESYCTGLLPNTDSPCNNTNAPLCNSYYAGCPWDAPKLCARAPNTNVCRRFRCLEAWRNYQCTQGYHTTPHTDNTKHLDLDSYCVGLNYNEDSECNNTSVTSASTQSPAQMII